MVLTRWNSLVAGNGRCDAGERVGKGNAVTGGGAGAADGAVDAAGCRGAGGPQGGCIAGAVRVHSEGLPHLRVRMVRLAIRALLGGAVAMSATMSLPVQAASFWHDPDLAVPGMDPFGDPEAFSGADAFSGSGTYSGSDVYPGADVYSGTDAFSGADVFSGPDAFSGSGDGRYFHPVSFGAGARGDMVDDGDDDGRGYWHGHATTPLGHGGHDVPGSDAGSPAQAPFFWRSQDEGAGGRPALASRGGRSWGCRPAAAVQSRLKVDNDLASGEDYGYSSGVMLEVAGRTSAHDGWGRESGQAGLLCPLWRWLGGGRIPSEYVSFRLDQAIYTPEASRATWLLTHDRPYAATLMATLAAGRLDGRQRVRNELRLGWVGPSIRGEKLQNAVHRVINAPRFRGWAHQLHDEPLLEWAQYRVQRWQPGSSGWDVLGHWGLRLGNLQSSTFAGLEWRVGNHLQDDGGSAPLRPGSNEPGELQWSRPAGAQWTTFLQAGVRAVAWDLTLDGNAWHDSHHVKRRPLVLDGGAGVSVRQGRWHAQFMWVVRSREFRGQRHVPSFGSLQIGYAF